MEKLDVLRKYRAELQEIYSKVGRNLLDANTAVMNEMRAQSLLFTLVVDFCCVGTESEEFESLEEAIGMAKAYEDIENGHMPQAWVVRDGKGETVASSE